jgi:hypothetical protein
MKVRHYCQTNYICFPSHELDFTDSGQCPATGLFEHSNELPGFIKIRLLLDQPNDCGIIKEIMLIFVIIIIIIFVIIIIGCWLST